MTAITPAIRPAIGPAVRGAFDGYQPSLTQLTRAIVRKYGGAIYDPSNLASLFQDSAGTLPVTGVAQPVGLVLDTSGNGNHLTQTTPTARPTYQIVDGKPCIVGDGVDDYLKTGVQIPAGPDRSTFLAVAARMISETVDNRIVMSARNPSPSRTVCIQRATVASGRYVGTVNYGAVIYPSITEHGSVGTTRVVALSSCPDVPTAAIWQNGAVGSTITNSVGTNANGPMGVELFSIRDGGAVSNAAIFGAVYLAGTPTDAERETLTRWHAQRGGVIL